MAYDIEWASLRVHYRKEVMRVLREIREGSVKEVDLDRLHNFCVTSLILMGKVQEPVWRKAEKDAEIASLKERVATLEKIVTDPAEQLKREIDRL